MRVPTLAAACIAAALLLACGGEDGDVEYLVVEPLSFEGWLPTGDVVIRTAAELQAFRDAAFRDTPDHAWGGLPRPASPPAFPAVDFSTHMVVGVAQALGNRCQRYVITRLIRIGTALTVQWKFDPPAASLICYSPPPQPRNALVRVRRLSGPVTFEWLQD